METTKTELLTFCFLSSKKIQKINIHHATIFDYLQSCLHISIILFAYNIPLQIRIFFYFLNLSIMKLSAFVFLVAFLFVINFSQSQNSVLSSGNWYKIAVDQTGIFQIGYEDLENYGIDPTQINPKHIKLFGNGNGMLPEPNSAFRYNDLAGKCHFCLWGR